MKTFKCTVQDSLGHVTRPKQQHSRPTATRIHLLHLGLWIRHHFLTQSSERWDKITATNPDKSSPCGAHIPLGAVPVCALDQTPAWRLDDIRLAKGWEWAKVEQLLLLAEQKISWCPAQHLQIYKTNKRMTDVMEWQKCMECHIDEIWMFLKTTLNYRYMTQNYVYLLFLFIIMEYFLINCRYALQELLL